MTPLKFTKRVLTALGFCSKDEHEQTKCFKIGQFITRLLVLFILIGIAFVPSLVFLLKHAHSMDIFILALIPIVAYGSAIFSYVTFFCNERKFNKTVHELNEIVTKRKLFNYFY